MPRSKIGIKRIPVNSQNIKLAVEAVCNSDNKISFRQAARAFNVSLTTLTRHVKAFREQVCVNEDFEYEYKIKNTSKQIFTDVEESSLVEYIKIIDRMQCGLSKKGVRKFAYKFALAVSKKLPPNWEEGEIAGEEWLRGFSKRWGNEISPRTTEAKNLTGNAWFNEHYENSFFDNLCKIHSHHGPVPPERVWKMDESRLTTVQKSSNTPEIGTTASAETGDLVTIIGCVNAAGDVLPPTFIFPRAVFKSSDMMRCAPDGALGLATPSGCSNETSFLEFLDHFIKIVKSSKSQPHLLILDNHKQHMPLEAIEVAKESGIRMSTFPPHCSLRLQPLDIATFGPLDSYYYQEIDEWQFSNPGKEFTFNDVAEVVGKVYNRDFSNKNIARDFKAEGQKLNMPGGLKRNIKCEEFSDEEDDGQNIKKMCLESSDDDIVIKDEFSDEICFICGEFKNTEYWIMCGTCNKRVHKECSVFDIKIESNICDFCR